jgi:hypothetical protein
MLFPTLYRPEQQDSLHVFRNWTDVGGELRRTVAVTWKAGVDTAMSSEALLAWRDATVKRYAHPQTVAPQPQQRRRVTVGDVVAFEVQGAWSQVYDGVPMGGAFIARTVPCPALERTFLVDAWLYAPGREKYEYMIQLQTLLNTFRCGAPAGSAAGRQ